MSISLDELAKSRNLLTLWRTWLAFLVFFSHGLVLFGVSEINFLNWSIGYHLPFSNIDYGAFAVSSFFLLSGFLVTRSALGTSPIKWLQNRLLRIIPAYFFVLLLTSFVVIPIIFFIENGNLNNYFNSSRSGPISYFFWNITFPIGLQYGINDIFSTNPFGIMVNGSSVNGNLWTLPIEIRCYFLSAFIVFFLNDRFRKLFAALLLLLLVSKKYTANLTLIDNIIDPISILQSETFVNLLIPFLIGINLSLHSKYLRFKNPRIVGIVILFVYFISKYFTRDTLPGELLFSLIPLLVLTKINESSRLRRLTNMPDLSYGMYLWSFPMTQITQLYFGSYSIYLRFGIALTLTFLLSLVSYGLVEKRIAILKSLKK